MRVRTFLLIIVAFILTACGEESGPIESNENGQTKISISFRNLDVQTEGNSFVLTGEVNTEESIFYYVLKQGENELISEQSVDVSAGAAGWANFKISGEIPEEALQREDTPIITMYGKSAEDEEINPNYIPIDVGVQ